MKATSSSVLASGKAILLRLSPYSTMGSRRTTRRRTLRTGALERGGWGCSVPWEGSTEAGWWGVWPPSEHTVRDLHTGRGRAKSARKTVAGMLSLRNPLGGLRNQAGFWILSGKSSPNAVCLRPSNTAPQSSPLLTIQFPFFGTVKRALGGCPSHSDGPGRDSGEAPRLRGLAPTSTLALLAPRPADPSRPLQAGAEGEDAVMRLGARGSGRGAGESQLERTSEVRARVGRGGRRAEGGEPSGAGRQGGPAPASLRAGSWSPPNPLTLLSPLDGGGAVARAAAGGSARNREPSRIGIPTGARARARQGGQRPSLKGGTPASEGASLGLEGQRR